MKTKALIIFIFIATLVSCQNNQSGRKKIDKSDIKTLVDSVSYGFGLQIGDKLKAQKVEINPDILLQGILDVTNGNEQLISDEDLKISMENYRKIIMKKMQEEREQLAEKNKEEEEKFFEENKKKEGVITLPSGLQYKVLKSGNGKSPKETDKVVVNYIGKYIDGTEFDNSYKRGKPFETQVSAVIKGWTEILPKMKEGDKWEVYIPSKLAYGERGSGRIEPNKTLIFEIELLKVK